MPIYTILIIALIQGLTEFLPVSSSGHLVLTHYLFGEKSTDVCWNQNRMIDVAVHVGTLFAVILYFYKDLWLMTKSVHRPHSEGFRMIRNVVVASIPIIIIGFIVNAAKPSLLCLIEVMAWMTVIFGVVLWIADRYSKAYRHIERMNWYQALIIGAAQSLALVPGTSRSGITMTAARFLGFTRTDSARFSLLLSIVAIGGAGSLITLDLIKSGNWALGQDVLLAVALSFIIGWGSIAVMMKWLQKYTFKPFAVYRIILGSLLLYLFYSGGL